MLEGKGSGFKLLRLEKGMQAGCTNSYYEIPLINMHHYVFAPSGNKYSDNGPYCPDQPWVQ